MSWAEMRSGRALRRPRRLPAAGADPCSTCMHLLPALACVGLQVIPALSGDATDQTPPDLPSYLFKERIVYLVGAGSLPPAAAASASGVVVGGRRLREALLGRGAAWQAAACCLLPRPPSNLLPACLACCLSPPLLRCLRRRACRWCPL